MPKPNISLVSLIHCLPEITIPRLARRAPGMGPTKGGSLFSWVMASKKAGRDLGVLISSPTSVSIYWCGLKQLYPSGLGLLHLLLGPSSCWVPFQVLHFKMLMYEAESWTKRIIGLYSPECVLKLCHAQQGRKAKNSFFSSLGGSIISWFSMCVTHQNLEVCALMPTWNPVIIASGRKKVLKAAFAGRGGRKKH